MLALPNRFGDWWPFGYPLIGSWLGLIGIPPFQALILVSALSFASVGALYTWAHGNWPKNWRTALLLLASCSVAPAVPLLLATPMSEPLFAVLLFAMAIFLGYWPNRWAIIASMIMMLFAFCVRYAGIFCFGAVFCYAMTVRKSLIETRAAKIVLMSWLGCVLVAAALCYTNYRAFGRFTGPQPTGQESFFTLPSHLSDLGYGGLGVFFSGGAQALRDWAEEAGNLARLSVGWAFMLAVFGLLVHSWRNPTNIFVRPMALVCLAYLSSMILLRSTTPFDNLNTPRTFVPALFPIAFLVSTTHAFGKNYMFQIGVALLMAIGILLAGRGMSPAVNLDITKLANELKFQLRPHDTVAVDGRATALAARFPNAFFPTAVDRTGVSAIWGPSSLWQPGRTNFTVFGGAPSDGKTSDGPYPEWSTIVAAAVHNGQVTIIHSDANGMILKCNQLDPPSTRRYRGGLQEILPDD